MRLDFFKLKKIYLLTFERGRERQRLSGGGAEREGDTNPKQTLGSELSAQSPKQGWNPQTVRS